MFRTRFLVLFLVIAGFVSAPVSAADPKAMAATDISQVDSDFAYQGEYLGSAVNDCGRCQPVGLQVVALGKGEFQAVEYLGGLPGYGWPIDGERIKYQGKFQKLRNINAPPMRTHDRRP